MWTVCNATYANKNTITTTKWERAAKGGLTAVAIPEAQHAHGRLICPSDGKPVSEWRKLCDSGGPLQLWQGEGWAVNPVLQQQWHNMVTSLLQRGKVMPLSCARVKGTEGHWQHSITQLWAPSLMNASDNTCWQPIFSLFHYKCPQLSALGVRNLWIHNGAWNDDGKKARNGYFQGTKAFLYSAYSRGTKCRLVSLCNNLMKDGIV